MEHYIDDLLTNMFSGVERALSRLISLVEEGSLNHNKVKERISTRLGKAYRIGVTGPAGCGKSTLIDKLTAIMRIRGLTVGIIAVDPSSSVTGGSFLGDRIRMQQHDLDNGVFIRSMATRGYHGGISNAVPIAVDLLDAFGRDIIMIETVGVGQTEAAITEVVNVVILVLTPEFGDNIQLMKAGLIEIADIIVINKADFGGAEKLFDELGSLLTISSRRLRQSITTVQAVNNKGVEELYQELEKLRSQRH